MHDGITARHGASVVSADNATSNGAVITNGGISRTIQFFPHQQHGSSGSSSPSPPCSTNSSPAKRCPSKPASPSHHAPCNGEFKLCSYDDKEDGAGSATTTSSGTSPAEVFGVLGFWLKLRHDLKSLPWEQLKAVKMKNARAAPGCAYIPTEVGIFSYLIDKVLTFAGFVVPRCAGVLGTRWHAADNAMSVCEPCLRVLRFVGTFEVVLH